MTIKEKYELLNKGGLVGNTYNDFIKRVKINSSIDESGAYGIGDLAAEIAEELIDHNDKEALQELLYMLIKH